MPQSFDYPSHTLLPGMKLGYDRSNGKIGSLISWKSREDPGPGVFSPELDPHGTSQCFIIKGYQKYWTSGEWNGQNFSTVPDLNALNLLDIAYFSRSSGNYFTYSVTDASVTSRFVLEISGKLEQLLWSETTHRWDLFWYQPSQQCEVYAYCGAFSNCSQKARPFCQCLPGFEPLSVGSWNAGDMSGGCARKVPLQCGNDSQANGQNDQFLWISKVRLPANPIVLQVRSAVDCESACFGNCSCSAYVYGSDGCSIWSEDLFNVEQLTNDDTDGRDFYLKLAASEFLSNVHPTLSANSRSKRWKWIFLALVVSMTLSTTALFYCMWRRRQLQNKGGDLLKFDIGTSVGPANCTRNEASKSLIGGNKEVDLP
ncbi:unnamed protein product [Camellia sinensis]